VGCATLAPLVLAGCDIDPPAPAPSPSGGAGSPAPDDDTALLAGVLGALDTTAAAVAAARARHPSLAASLQPLVHLHAAHREVLGAAAPELDPSAAPTPAVPGRPAAAAALVRRDETRLVGDLRRATVAAESGDFARALASMAASVTQHLVVLGGGVAP
jgi:hypothetical protein